MHNLQCCSESEVNVKQKPLEKIPEPRKSDRREETGTSSQQNKAGVRSRYSLAREKKALSSRLKGTQPQADLNTKKNYHR